MCAIDLFGLKSQHIILESRIAIAIAYTTVGYPYFGKKVFPLCA